MAHKKKFVFKKNIPEEVNPIAFGCNQAMVTRLDRNVSRGDISDSPEVRAKLNYPRAKYP